MATNRFFGPIGYALPAQETAPDVFVEQIVERELYGERVRSARRLEEGEKVNMDLSVDVSLSVVADEFAYNHIHAMRYVKWAGVLWTVTNVQPEGPRLILRLGGEYHGPTPE